MSTIPPPLPPEIFGGIGMDGRQLRSYLTHNTLMLLDIRRNEIEKLKTELTAAQQSTAKQILVLCDASGPHHGLAYEAGWNSALKYVKTRIKQEILSNGKIRSKLNKRAIILLPKSTGQ